MKERIGKVKDRRRKRGRERDSESQKKGLREKK